MISTEFPAGAGQRIVVYVSDDTGEEIDIEALFTEIAADAAKRDAEGWRISSMAGLPERHAQGMFARSGSGYSTKASVAVVYASNAEAERAP